MMITLDCDEVLSGIMILLSSHSPSVEAFFVVIVSRRRQWGQLGENHAEELCPMEVSHQHPTRVLFGWVSLIFESAFFFFPLHLSHLEEDKHEG